MNASVLVLCVSAMLAFGGMAVAGEPAPAFKLPALPYAVDALEPVIDAQTMTIHHERHHQAYVDGLNKAVAADPALHGQSLEAMLAKAGSLAPAVRNHGGGHWNHNFFWASLVAPAQSGQPSADLARAIEDSFGSIEDFKAAFRQAGTGRFGSGWVWLIVGEDGKLAITSTPNQDNPLMDVAEVKGTPILGNDVWEHAYYLKHQNRRGDYLDAWWQVVNWAEISGRFARAAD